MEVGMAQSKKNAPHTGTSYPPEPTAGDHEDSPTRIGIIGAGRGGSAPLRLLTGIEGVKVVGICDIDPHAPGLAEADRLGIPCYRNAEELVEAETMDWIISVSHTSLTQRVVLRQSLHGVEVIDGDIGELIWRILTAFDRLLDPGEGFTPSPAEFIRSFRDLAWQVVSEITMLVQHAHDRLTEMACRDPLTGLYTRRILAEFLLQDTVTSLRSGRPLGVMLIDLDHFKSVNDRFGYEAGDALLRDFADLLRGACRAGDIAARHGGEEFVVALPGADAAASASAAWPSGNCGGWTASRRRSASAWPSWKRGRTGSRSIRRNCTARSCSRPIKRCIKPRTKGQPCDTGGQYRIGSPHRASRGLSGKRQGPRTNRPRPHPI